MLQAIDELASNVELKPGESMTIVSENIRIHSVEWHPKDKTDEDEEHLEFNVPVSIGIVEEETDEEDQSTTTVPTTIYENTNTSTNMSVSENTITSTNTSTKAEKPNIPVSFLEIFNFYFSNRTY